ncbi:MAG: hypothetical protein V1256_07490 [Candidatus Neomarinimicrobiota bacterium]|jgi:hypothetical protein|nr:hypothetical protein [Candidatus Neomarinimicrobiota bacterium]MEE1506781.1 hypothetical protein [Candidatus Neomarinimicrobiota bacterium]MEE1572974.1 hypothetical protein [Candidatus Neomarinimicrobiota bacterium]HJN68146.1 hypothetical protein [Candidatus Neomarinimicrobiota bacterium]|tara:strand:+ start:16 stop:516 length:501 start_codon:yes stop_codon:yes gene_type:complete
MWIFMISCYLLTGCSLLLFILTGIQGYFQFPVFGLNHPALALLTASIYLFTESLITFFFVGAGADIKQYMAEGLAEETDYNQSILIKKKLYPPTMLNILLVIIVFIIGGAVDTNIFPSWPHGLLYVITLVHFLKMIKTQNSCFKETVAIRINIAEKGNAGNQPQSS